MQDAFAEALSITYRRRAELLDWARPQPGDWPGASRPTDRARRDWRLQEAAKACRRRADIALVQTLDDELADIIGGAA